jgi:hypothetical protein
MNAQPYAAPNDLPLASMAQFALKRWKLALRLSAGLTLFGALAYFTVIPYTISTTVQINDAQTSQLQAFTNNFFSLGKTQASNARKATTPSQAVADYLDRQDTYTSFVRFLAFETASAGDNPDLRAGLEGLEAKVGGSFASPALNWRQTAATLRKMVKLSNANPGELMITTYAGSRDLAYFLNSEYSKFAVDELQKHEEKEMEAIRSAILRQRDYFKEQFEAKNKELIAFQSRPENVLSLASGPNVGNYISELLVRQNEIKLKITENERALQFLGGAKAAELAKSRQMGGRSQAQMLFEENDLLSKQVSAINDSIKKFSGATNGAAEAMRMHEELQKTSDREFRNYQESNDLLSKLTVYAVSIAGKFEIEHVPEFEDVKKAASLYLVLAVAFFLAQLIFSGIVYAAWNNGSQPVFAATVPAATPVRHRDTLVHAGGIKVVQEMAANDLSFLAEKGPAKEVARSLH